MTFIASVIAKDGVALIADSFATTIVPSIQISEFLNYLKEKAERENDEKIKLTPEEIIDLFKLRPSHTKDFEEKLFEFDKYTAITTAGTSTVNDKKIQTVIEEVKAQSRKDKHYNKKNINTKIDIFRKYLENQINEHLTKKSSIKPTKFIVTHFIKAKNKTKIFKIYVNSATSDDLKNEGFEFVSVIEANDWEKVVCDGQNRISEKILFGGMDDIYELVPRIVLRIFEDFNIKIEQKEINDYINKIRKDKKIISPNLFEEMKIFKLSELSLQQAVDLANLLMKIEIDFQTYTENISTVGGVIKIAIIDKNGFRYISGHEIIKPL